MRGAVAANLDLKAADLEVESGAQDVRLARSSLLPQVESRFGGTVTREGTAAASLGQQPQRQLDGELSFSVPLYSEQAWAGYGSERRLQKGREAGREQTRLDVVLDAAQAYISVLQARTLADVRRSNLYRNRTNLETARVREDVGSTSRADVYRWQGEVANARRDLIAAESQVQVATLTLKRVLNRPLDRPLAERPVTLGDPALLAQDSTVLGWFGDPARYAVLTRFLVGEALRVSPELAQADAAIAAAGAAAHGRGARLVDADALPAGRGLQRVQPGRRRQRRAHPAGRNRPGDRARPAVAIPDPGVAAALHRIPAGRRRGRRAGFDLERLKVERAGAAQTVEQRVRAALETAASSYAAISLTREASDAANRNYELVSDAYARGTASITALDRRPGRGRELGRGRGERSARLPAGSHAGRARDGRLRRPPPGRAAAGLPRTPTHSGGAAMSRTHWIAAAALAATACGGDPPAAVPPVPVSVVQVGGSSGRPRRDAVQRRDQGRRVGGPGVPGERHRGRDHPGTRGRRSSPRDPGRRPGAQGPGARPAAPDRVPRPGGRRRRHAAPVRGGLRARLAAVREPLDQQGRVRRRLRPLHREPGPAEPGGDLPRRRDARGAARRRAPAPLGGGRVARWAVGARRSASRTPG